MRSRAAIRVVLPAALLLSACIDAGPGYSNGYEHVNVDGSYAHAEVLPPVGYYCYPHWFERDGYVYNVNGLYYKDHDGNWSIMRGAPSLVRYEEPELSNDPRCLAPAP
jgi:hypothetical protein